MSDRVGVERHAAAARLPTLLAAAVVLAVLSPTLLYPYGRDQAVFAYVGDVIARGGMPYRDAWEVKPPGIYLLYALLARAAPSAGWSLMLLVRAADVAAALLTALLVAALVRRVSLPDDPAAPEPGHRWLAAAAAAWYAALYLHTGYWCLAQAESWANPLALGSILALLGTTERPTLHAPRPTPHAPRPTPGTPWVAVPPLAAGLLTGAAALLKFSAVLPVLPSFLFLLWRRKGSALPPAALFLLGASAPLVLAVLWLRGGGAWESYLEIQRGFVAPYAKEIGGDPLRRMGNLFGYTLEWMKEFWVPVLLAGVGVWVAERRTRLRLRLRLRTAPPAPDPVPHPITQSPNHLITAALLAGLAAVWAQNKYFGYHWQTALPFLAVLTAGGAAALLGWPRVPARLGWVLGLLAPLAWSLAAHFSDYRDGALHAAGRLPREAWLTRFGAPGRGDYSFLADTQAANYVRRRTRPGDGVVVWGFETAVYLFSDRRPPTRFLFTLPVTSPLSPPGWRREFLEAVRSRPPELFLVCRNDAVPWASGTTKDSAAQLEDWSELAACLAADYRLEAQVEDFAVYRRKPGREPL